MTKSTYYHAEKVLHAGTKKENTIEFTALVQYTHTWERLPGGKIEHEIYIQSAIVASGILAGVCLMEANEEYWTKLITNHIIEL